MPVAMTTQWEQAPKELHAPQAGAWHTIFPLRENWRSLEILALSNEIIVATIALPDRYYLLMAHVNGDGAITVLKEYERVIGNTFLFEVKVPHRSARLFGSSPGVFGLWWPDGNDIVFDIYSAYEVYPEKRLWSFIYSRSFRAAGIVPGGPGDDYNGRVAYLNSHDLVFVAHQSTSPDIAPRASAHIIRLYPGHGTSSYDRIGASFDIARDAEAVTGQRFITAQGARLLDYGNQVFAINVTTTVGVENRGWLLAYQWDGVAEKVVGPLDAIMFTDMQGLGEVSMPPWPESDRYGAYADPGAHWRGVTSVVGLSARVLMATWVKRLWDDRSSSYSDHLMDVCRAYEWAGNRFRPLGGNAVVAKRDTYAYFDGHPVPYSYIQPLASQGWPQWNHSLADRVGFFYPGWLVHHSGPHAGLNFRTFWGSILSFDPDFRTSMLTGAMNPFHRYELTADNYAPIFKEDRDLYGMSDTNRLGAQGIDFAPYARDDADQWQADIRPGAVTRIDNDRVVMGYIALKRDSSPRLYQVRMVVVRLNATAMDTQTAMAGNRLPTRWFTKRP